MISPKWAGFKATDYYQASLSVYREEELRSESGKENDLAVEVAAGDFDLRGFEVSRSALFDSVQKPCVILQQKQIKFNSGCVRKFARGERVELLIHPRHKLLAVRAAPKESRHFVTWARKKEGKLFGKEIPCAAFGDTLFHLFHWNTDCKYQVPGTLIERGGESVMLFNLSDAEAYIKQCMIDSTDESTAGIEPLAMSGKRVRAIPEAWADEFGSQYYLHRFESTAAIPQDEESWNLRMESQLYETGRKLNVTSFADLKSYIRQELSRGAEASGGGGEGLS